MYELEVFSERVEMHFSNSEHFMLFARTHKFLSPDKLYIKIANERRREYAERVQQVEDADFTPMIISSSGGGQGDANGVKALE